GLLRDHFVSWGPNVDVLKGYAAGVAPMAGVRRQFGNMILSRFPILTVRNHPLPKYGASELMDMQRGALEAVVAAPGESLRVYCTHLCHLSDTQRRIQAIRLLDIHARAVAEGPPLAGVHPSDPSWSSEPSLPPVPRQTIILGDFNAQPASETYAAIVGQKSPRFGHMRRRGGFVDAWCAAGHGEADGTGATRYESAADKAGRRIDYCFVSE